MMVLGSTFNKTDFGISIDSIRLVVCLYTFSIFVMTFEEIFYVLGYCM